MWPLTPSSPPHHDGPLTIHNRSVEEYQQIYHEVVDEMLKYVCVNDHESFNQIIITFYLKRFYSTFPYKFFNHTYRHDFISVSSAPHRFKNGWVHPYSLELGCCIKHKLWERLDRPMIQPSADEDGLLHVDVSCGVGVYPPLYDVDTLGEPEPKKLPKKRAKN